MNSNDDFSLGSIMPPPDMKMIQQWEQDIEDEGKKGGKSKHVNGKTQIGGNFVETPEETTQSNAANKTTAAAAADSITGAANDTIEQSDTANTKATPPDWMTNGGPPPPTARLTTPLVAEFEGNLWLATSSLTTISIALMLVAKMGSKASQLDNKFILDGMKGSIQLAAAQAREIKSSAKAEADSETAQAALSIVSAITSSVTLAASLRAGLSSSRETKKMRKAQNERMSEHLPYRSNNDHTLNSKPADLSIEDKAKWRGQLGKPGKNPLTGKTKTQKEIDLEQQYDLKFQMEKSNRKARGDDNATASLSAEKKADAVYGKDFRPYMPEKGGERMQIKDLSKEDRAAWKEQMGKPGNDMFTGEPKTKQQIEEERDYRNFKMKSAEMEMQSKQNKMMNINMMGGMVNQLTEAAQHMVKGIYINEKAQHDANNQILAGFAKQMDMFTSASQEALKSDQETASQALQMFAQTVRENSQRKWSV